jgi:hypothetical protein
VPCESAAPTEPPIASESPAASESTSAFCALLTSDEIQTLIGSPVIETGGDDTSCGWVSAGADSSTIILVQDLAISDFDQLQSTTLPGMSNTPISGVGDAAFLQTLNDTVTVLYMKKGDRGIQVTVVDSSRSNSDIGTLETKLAQIIAGRI